MLLFRLSFSVIALWLGLVAATPATAQCITSKAAFGQYKAHLADRAARAGIGERGLRALGQAKLSGITWRFESKPSSQTGLAVHDPAQFLAKRSGASAERFITQVRSRIAGNPNTYAAIEKAYGVPASVLVTIWGLETNWGGYMGGTPIVSGAVTLASYCRRYPRFESHAIAALRLVDKGVISASSRGGPSGELGHMQFLAGNWETYAVDADRNGRADPMNSVDALSSAANMLRRNGWKAGQPFGPGTRNFEVLSVWNDSGNYQRAIVYAAERVGP